MRSMHSAALRFFLQRLLAARIARRLTQQEAADALGIPRSRLSRMEGGQRRVDVIELEEMAILYRKPLKWFVPPRR